MRHSSCPGPPKVPLIYVDTYRVSSCLDLHNLEVQLIAGGVSLTSIIHCFVLLRHCRIVFSKEEAHAAVFWCTAL